MGACLSKPKTKEETVSTKTITPPTDNTNGITSPTPDKKPDTTTSDKKPPEATSNGVDKGKGVGGKNEEVKDEPIEDYYVLGKEIGRGGFSVVREGTHIKTGVKYAIKCISKEQMESEDEIKLLLREVQIMKKN